MPGGARDNWLRESLVYWFFGPILGLGVVLLSTAVLPGGGCEEGPVPITAEHTLERGVVIGVAYVVSMLCWMAAWRLIVESRREEGDWLPPAPHLVAAVVLVLGGAALYASPGLRSGYAFFGFAGCLLAFILCAAVGMLMFRGRSLAEARDYTDAYLIVSALFVYPSVALLALHLSAHPFCGFG